LPAEQAQNNGRDDSNAPPDGGLQAWLQVVASFALYFNHLYGKSSFHDETMFDKCVC
jgi:hypothetical protein